MRVWSSMDCILVTLNVNDDDDDNHGTSTISFTLTTEQADCDSDYRNLKPPIIIILNETERANNYYKV